MKLYFKDECDDSGCYPIVYWRHYKTENKLESLTLFEAERETGTGYFFCLEFLEVGERGNCGKECHKYKPNNGKNGRCSNYGYCYERTEKTIVI